MKNVVMNATEIKPLLKPTLSKDPLEKTKERMLMDTNIRQILSFEVSNSIYLINALPYLGEDEN